MHAVDIQIALLIHDIDHFVETLDTLPKHRLLPVLEHLQVQYQYMTERQKPQPPHHLIALVKAAIVATAKEIEDGQTGE